MSIDRNHALDSLRLIAAFCVVAIHIPSYADLPAFAGPLIRLFSRWAVPFFFLVAGYYLLPKESFRLDKIPEKMARILFIFLFASLMYIPVKLFQKGPVVGMLDIFSFGFVINGASFHLWFFSAMVMGLFFIYSVCTWGFEKYLGILCAVISIAVVLLSSYNRVFIEGGISSNQIIYMRHLSAIPFLGIGLIISKCTFKHGWKLWIALAGFGFILQILEALMLNRFYSVDPNDLQLLFGTFLSAIGILCFVITFPRQGGMFLADYGRQYALGIYVLHIMVRKGIVAFDIINSSLLLLISNFVVTLIVLVLIERYIPSLKRLMDGKLTGFVS